ncbi:MAG: hypothetical protein FJ029_11855 [Actinobacteria bacterium]|nr:hypothetical protein [Actinomycetota bacterium]
MARIGWALLSLLALLWPGTLSGPLDGAPLQGRIEAILIGLAVPVLIWLHPSFLRLRLARGAIVLVLVTKIAAPFLLTQEGLCIAFEPPYPMVRDSTGKPHAWDMRADWLAPDPQCSAIMTRSYRDTFEVPAWFYNLPPPNDAVVRTGFSPGEIAVRMRGTGYISVGAPGTLQLTTGPQTNTRALVNGVPMPAAGPGRQEIPLPAGVHALQFDGTLLGKEWPVVPDWNGIEMGAAGFPLVTKTRPSRFERAAMPWAGTLLTLLIGAVLAAWVISALRSIGDGVLRSGPRPRRSRWRWSPARCLPRHTSTPRP